MPKSAKPTTASESNDSLCDCCNQQFDRRGLAAHQAACFKKADQQRKDAEFDARMQDLRAQKRLREGMHEVQFKLTLIIIMLYLIKKHRLRRVWRNLGRR